jgi:hypothetical protein
VRPTEVAVDQGGQAGLLAGRYNVESPLSPIAQRTLDRFCDQLVARGKVPVKAAMG